MNLYAKIGDNRLYNNPPKSVIQKENLVKVDTELPTENHVAQEDGTWALSENKIEKAYEADMKSIDSMLNHYNGHVAARETEEAKRALKKYLIARAEVKEKYDKGSKVLVTETGSCYHTSSVCSALTGHETKEINLSEGLKKYEACSICASEE